MDFCKGQYVSADRLARDAIPIRGVGVALAVGIIVDLFFDEENDEIMYEVDFGEQMLECRANDLQTVNI